MYFMLLHEICYSSSFSSLQDKYKLLALEPPDELPTEFVTGVCQVKVYYPHPSVAFVAKSIDNLRGVEWVHGLFLFPLF